MDYFKKIGILFVPLLFCLSFASCESDEDDIATKTEESAYQPLDIRNDMCGRVFYVTYQYESWSDESNNTQGGYEVNEEHTVLVAYEYVDSKDYNGVQVHFVNEFTIDIDDNDDDNVKTTLRTLAIRKMSLDGMTRTVILECNSKREIFPQYYSSEYYTKGKVKDAYYEYYEYVTGSDGKKDSYSQYSISLRGVYNATLFDGKNKDEYTVDKPFHVSSYAVYTYYPSSSSNYISYSKFKSAYDSLSNN